VLEALLKRVDGLEARLKEKKTDSETPTLEIAHGDTSSDTHSTAAPSNTSTSDTNPKSSLTETIHDLTGSSAISTPTPPR